MTPRKPLLLSITDAGIRLINQDGVDLALDAAQVTIEHSDGEARVHAIFRAVTSPPPVQEAPPPRNPNARPLWS